MLAVLMGAGINNPLSDSKLERGSGASRRVLRGSGRVLPDGGWKDGGSNRRGFDSNRLQRGRLSEKKIELLFIVARSIFDFV